MEEKEIRSGSPALGSLTYTDLGCAGVFSRAPEPDAFGGRRIPFSPPLARMSAELAANVYDLQIQPWVKAGWMDCSFVIEDKVVALDRDSDSKLAAIENEWKRRRARTLIRGLRPIGDLMRAARQLFVTDMGKSVVMARALPDGRAVIAISFIGTTQKFFDWFSNFKMQPHTGMHYGFLQLARQFDAQAARVLLPGLAAAFQEETYTLLDALLEAKREDSRVVFWISGHSQGGALVQTYTHLLLERGIRPELIFAYSFAAPTVTVCGGVSDPKAYPVFNVVNTDDIVSRVGSQVRLGVDLVYFPDDPFRAAHYGVETPLQKAFDRMLFVGGQVRSTSEGLCFGIALTRMLYAMDVDKHAELLLTEIIPHLSLLRKMGLDTREIAIYAEGKMAEYHRAFTGAAPDDALCDRYAESLRLLSCEFGPRDTARALALALRAPHRIQPDPRDESFIPPYIAIVRRHLSEATPGVWLPGTTACRVDRHGIPLFPNAASAPSLPKAEPALLPSPESGAGLNLEENGND